MNEQAAIATVHAFLDAFNDQDQDRLATTLNYPHVRLAGGRFLTIADADDFLKRMQGAPARLAAEGWHHTVLKDLNVVHSGPDKVHVALSMDRCHEDGTVYNAFHSLWIPTLQDGHWGIQFRSSYLITG